MKRYIVKPDSKVRLLDWDPSDTHYFDGSKKEAKVELQSYNLKLRSLQELLFAESKHKLLIVLQAMDTGGKDGTIRHVFNGINPQGMKVTNFKSPTKREVNYDYLWRVHQKVPAKGEIGIFNRSHYEDVLIVRIHDLVPKSVWKKRFTHINEFERMLCDEGTTVLKFFLHIDKDEQKRRLEARLSTPEKHWKFDPSDISERKLWDQYVAAYEEVLEKTSTDWAPWRVIPGNNKAYRNLVIAKTICKTLEGLNMSYPKPAEGLDKIVVV